MTLEIDAADLPKLMRGMKRPLRISHGNRFLAVSLGQWHGCLILSLFWLWRDRFWMDWQQQIVRLGPVVLTRWK